LLKGNVAGCFELNSFVIVLF